MARFRNERHAFWCGVRDGALILLGAAIVGFGGAVVLIWAGLA